MSYTFSRFSLLLLLCILCSITSTITQTDEARKERGDKTLVEEVVIKLEKTNPAPVKRPGVMPWMCLEICDSPEDVQVQLETLRSKVRLLTAISFEKYVLFDDCTLGSPNSYLAAQSPPSPPLSEVTVDVQAMGLQAWPLISSWPHPPEFMDFIRQLFKTECADRFIDATIVEANLHGYTGYNLDWEPTASNATKPVTSEDAIQYANFVDRFAKRLHTHGYLLTVDVATWVTVPGGPSFWDYSALNATAVDSAISMGTYTGNDASFTNQLKLINDAFGTGKDGRATVGLQTINASSGMPLSDEEVAFRFKSMSEANVYNVALWKTPIPDNFWEPLERFVGGWE